MPSIGVTAALSAITEVGCRATPMSAEDVDVASQSQPSNKGRRKIHGVTIQASPDGVVANRWSWAMALVKVMWIPCFGCRMTLGRASIVWPGTS